MQERLRAPLRIYGALSALGIQGELHQLDFRTRLFLAQFPLLVGGAVAVAGVALTNPEALGRLTFLAGVLIIVGVSVATLAIPWERFPKVVQWILPLLDLVAVGLMHGANADGPVFLAALSLFPIFWLAWSGVAPRTARIISFTGPLLIVWSPVLTEHVSGDAASLAGPLLWPVITLGLAIAVSMTDLSTTAQQKISDRQEAKLQQALQESSRREQLLNTVLNTINLDVLAMDLSGAIVLSNNAQKRNHLKDDVFGAHSTTGDEPFVFGTDKVTPMPREERPMARALRGESFSDLLIWVGQEPHQRAVLTSARPICTADGVHEGAVIVANDVTNLVTALSTRDDFVASVSHELRTPLTSIMGYLDLVLEDTTALPPGVAATLRTVARNSERLQKLVSDLLTTAADQLHLQPVSTDVTALIRNTVELAGPRAAANEVAMSVELPERLNAVVDPHRMEQVLDNLISNAIKYSPGGTVTIRAETTATQLHLKISDTGIGIAEADQKEVFTKFFRTQTARISPTSGVGLGLAITREIVEAHGGTITVVSTVGRGSTFTVTVPTAPAKGLAQRVRLPPPKVSLN